MDTGKRAQQKLRPTVRVYSPLTSMMMVMIITANVYIVSSAVSFSSFQPRRGQAHHHSVTQLVSEIKTQSDFRAFTLNSHLTVLI